MANILTRFGDIISANINALLDKAEDPSKMIDQYLRNASEDLAEVKKQTAAVMAEETRCRRLLDECTENSKKYNDLAKKALSAGNEADAKVFIAKKQEYDAQLPAVQKAYDAAHANADKMRQMHDKLVSDINELKARRSSVKATMAVAQTQQRVNEAQAAFDGASGALSGFTRMEEKAQRMLDESEAMAQLQSTPEDSAETLAEKYAGGGDTAVDDELARLKAEMGL